MKKQAEEWLNAALDDLNVINKICNEASLTNMVAFHAQQAVEKSLKSILEEFESRVPRTHNLINLIEMTGKYFKLDVDRSSIERINEVYTDTRYPSDLGLVPNGKPSLELADVFQQTAIHIHKQVFEHLS